MKNTLLLAAALIVATTFATAQQTVYSVQSGTTESQNQTFLTVSDSQTSPYVIVTGGTAELSVGEVNTAKVATGDATYYGIKLSNIKNYILATPNGGFHKGDTITITAFCSAGGEKNSTIKMAFGKYSDYDDADTISTKYQYIDKENGFPDIKEGNDYYVDGRPGKQTYVLTDDYSCIKFLRNSSLNSIGASSLYVISIVVTRPDTTTETQADKKKRKK